MICFARNSDLHRQNPQAALNATKPRGTIVLKGTHDALMSIDLNRIVVDEITIRGSRCGNIGNALQFLTNASIDPRPLITARYPLEQVSTAFEQASHTTQMKVLLEP